jgi:hypothetical protein
MLIPIRAAHLERECEKRRQNASRYLYDGTAGSQLAVNFNPAYADLLFDGTGHTFAEIAALGKDRKALPRWRSNLQRRDGQWVG